MRQPGRGGEDAGGVHRVLGAVAGAHGDLAAQHEGYGTVPAVHVARPGDLVEELVGGDPHEVGVHELHDRREAAVERDAAGQAGEGVLADRGAEDPVGEALGETAGRSVGAAVEAVDVLAHDDDAGVGLHPATEDGGDGLDELHLLDGYGVPLGGHRPARRPSRRGHRGRRRRPTRGRATRRRGSGAGRACRRGPARAARRRPPPSRPWPARAPGRPPRPRAGRAARGGRR